MENFRKLIVAGIVLVFAWGCKGKEKKVIDPGKKFFPALSYIKNQVAKVDTSVYSIMRIVFVDSARIDTTWIRREEFRNSAADFLALPDLAAPEYNDRFTEENQFDETLGRVLMTYTPVNAKDEIVQRQEILIKPDTPEDKVTSIFINTSQSNKDSTVERKLFWKVDESFQVTTIKQYPGQPEITSTYKVSWNESEQ
jgi:hypothetical protein